MTRTRFGPRREGSALVWTALVLTLLPSAALVIVDGPATVAAWQSGQAALTEAWQATGTSHRLPSAAQLATMTSLCAEVLPSDVHLSSPVAAVSSGLTTQVTVLLPLPVLDVRTVSVTLTLPVTWVP
jgi:Flp pilus assembly protein TadG